VFSGKKADVSADHVSTAGLVVRTAIMGRVGVRKKCRYERSRHHRADANMGACVNRDQHRFADGTGKRSGLSYSREGETTSSFWTALRDRASRLVRFVP